ncbi:MAG: pyrroline-5-carboxylate reductase [Myxococcota bacterium]
MTSASNKLSKNIAFIGAGAMAEAIIKGLLASGACSARELIAADMRAERLHEIRETYGIEVDADNAQAASKADVVVLSIKPQAFGKALPSLTSAIDPSKLLVSIAAGIPVRVIEHLCPTGTRVVRTMPNTPVIVDAGCTGIAAGTHATPEDVALTQRIFEQIGMTVTLDEALLDAVTGLSGSGPAYIFLIIEALADAGVKVGLHRQAAQKLAAQTVLGSAQLLIETGAHPGLLKDKVTSPGGTAIAGLHTLEAGGLRTTLIDAVEAATSRARELGEELSAKLTAGSNRTQ